VTFLPFSLEPFPGESLPAGLRISGSLCRNGVRLSLDCSLSGDPSGLAVPAPAAAPERRGRLWEETCLECFLAETGSEAYREFHLSPSGHWNAYRFSGYREGMREEEAVSALPFLVRRTPGDLRFSAELDLSGLGYGTCGLEAEICAVLRAQNGGTSHWALAHRGPRPDFHRRDGFLLKLPGIAEGKGRDGKQ